MKRHNSLLCILLVLILLLTATGCNDLLYRIGEKTMSFLRSDIISLVTTTLPATQPPTTLPPTTQPTEPPTTAPFYEEKLTDVRAPFFGLYLAENGQKLYSKASSEKIHPASMAKLVTSCVALDTVSPDTVFTVGSEQELVNEDSSLCHILPGHMLTVRALLKGMLLNSGNDAGYTVAVNIARIKSGDALMDDTQAVAYFAEMMNEFAVSVGAENSNFTNPVGWDDEAQYTTLDDLALIAAHAMEYEEIRQIAAIQSEHVYFFSGESITWYNTNALLDPENEYYLPCAIGLKTGTTDFAGSCIIAAVKSGNTEYLAIVAGCADDEERYSSVHKIVGSIKTEATAEATTETIPEAITE